MLRVGLPNVRLNSNNRSITRTEIKKYHPPQPLQDTVRKNIMVDLNRIENDRLENNKKVDIKTNELHLNRDFSSNNDNGNRYSVGNENYADNKISDGYRYSYARLSYLYKNGKITQEQLWDLKAQKQGFKNHYERVLMRYMEVVKSYKFKSIDGSFKDAKEKHRLFKQMKAMEGFLREKERERESELNHAALHIAMPTMEGCC